MKKLLCILLLFCLLTPTALATTTCPSCQADGQIYTYCAYCGVKMPDSCSACGWVLPDGASFNYCVNCGTKLAYMAGDYILFGHYEQDGDPANGSEPIEWIVLAAEDHSLLLMSRYAFPDFAYDTSGETGVTWKTSTLRQTLNGDFYNAAFTAEEQTLILSTTVATQQEYHQDVITTTDKVYLLDCDEFLALSEELRICQNPPYTEYARTSACFWWLRDGPTANHTGMIATFFPTREIDWYSCNGYAQSSVRPVIRIIAP